MAIGTITGAEWNRQGITREVILTRRYAIKVPKLIYGWHKFLCGLLANMQEVEFGASRNIDGDHMEGLCPVLFFLPGGWLLVMPRVELLTDVEWSAFDAKAFCEREHYTIPAEFKQDSFGKLRGQIVAIDYGN